MRKRLWGTCSATLSGGLRLARVTAWIGLGLGPVAVGQLGKQETVEPVWPRTGDLWNAMDLTGHLTAVPSHGPSN